VMVINPTQETVSLNVINWPLGAAAKFNVIAKIHKYKELYEGHHFIPMTMEVHGALRHEMDHFIKECVRICHNRRSGDHLSLFFCIQFFR
jgi:hypothetical protein